MRESRNSCLLFSLVVDRCRSRLRVLQRVSVITSDLPPVQRMTVDALMCRDWADTLELVHEGPLTLRISKEKHVSGK